MKAMYSSYNLLRVGKMDLGENETDLLPETVFKDDSQRSETISISACVKIVIYVVVILTGVFFNGLVVIVYVKELKKSTYIFNTSLAICDLVNCLLLAGEIVKLLNFLTEQQMNVVCVWLEYASYFGCMVSAGLVVCVTLDRYLRVRHLCYSLPRSHTVGFISVIGMTSFIVTLPFVVVHTSPLKHEVHYRDHSTPDSADHLCLRMKIKTIRYMDNGEENARHEISSAGGIFWVVFLIVFIACLVLGFLAIIVLYIKISHLLAKKARTRSARPTSGSSSIEFSYDVDTDEESSVHAERASTPNVKGNMRSKPFRHNRVGFTEDLSRIVQEKSIAKNRDDVKTDVNIDVALDEPTSPLRYFKHLRRNLDVRRASNTSSIASSNVTSVCSVKTAVMILIAVFVFMLYFPGYSLQLVLILNKDTCVRFQEHYRVLLEFVIRSNVVCFIVNPFLYAFQSRGFFQKLKRRFGIRKG